MLHNIESITLLADRIKAYDEEVRVVLEATGHYHFPVTTMLAKKSVFVTCINSLRMKKYCAQSLRRAKTDAIDSIKIASYGLTYWDELVAFLPLDDTYAGERRAACVNGIIFLTFGHNTLGFYRVAG